MPTVSSNPKKEAEFQEKAMEGSEDEDRERKVASVSIKMLAK